MNTLYVCILVLEPLLISCLCVACIVRMVCIVYGVCVALLYRTNCCVCIKGKIQQHATLTTTPQNNNTIPAVHVLAPHAVHAVTKYLETQTSTSVSSSHTQTPAAGSGDHGAPANAPQFRGPCHGDWMRHLRGVAVAVPVEIPR